MTTTVLPTTTASPTSSMSTAQVGKDEKVRRDGFRINSMNMKDAKNGEILWESKFESERWFNRNGNQKEPEQDELTAHLPKDILQRQSITRQIHFSSNEEIKCLKLVQDVKLNGMTIEQWKFDFGFVVPHSTNAWEQTIASNGKTMDPTLLSGNVVFDTSFFDGDELIANTSMRIYYD
mmetsp:Transcript_8158/g.9511  ORF Transcript_8158/g.9511 Transcript_8158/m.9511 type:complete len:178 (-) Transcript_8158:254-787(-)